jgi:hypothetical protein
MNEAFICDALRIPFARYAGSLSAILAAIRDGARTITHKPNLLRKRSRRVEFWLRTGFRFGLAGRRPGDDLLYSARNAAPSRRLIRRVPEQLTHRVRTSTSLQDKVSQAGLRSTPAVP